jgi:hypothetical protein
MGADDDDRLILAALTSAYPAMIHVEALRALDGVQHPNEAVSRLRDDGLVTRAGDLIGTSRAFPTSARAPGVVAVVDRGGGLTPAASTGRRSDGAHEHEWPGVSGSCPAGLDVRRGCPVPVVAHALARRDDGPMHSTDRPAHLDERASRALVAVALAVLVRIAERLPRGSSARRAVALAAEPLRAELA